MKKTIITISSIIVLGLVLGLAGYVGYRHNQNNKNQLVRTKTSQSTENSINSSSANTVSATSKTTPTAITPSNQVSKIAQNLGQANKAVVAKIASAPKITKTKTEISQKLAAADQSAHKISELEPKPVAIPDKTTFSLRNINPKALKLGLNAYYKLQKEGKNHSKYLTLVDFSKPSTDPNRLTVIDVPAHKIVMHGLVAHGKGSGALMATKFSNKFGTDASSLGVYMTGSAFDGKHGLSLHIHGLEKGINDHANARTIEIHPAKYVSQAFIKKTGRIGRSWGCFAVNPDFSKQLIHTIKDGSVLFAYANSENNDPFVNMA